MQKTIKVVSVLLVVMMCLFTLSTVVRAADIEDILDQMNTAGESTDANGVASIGGQVASVITTAGIVIAVIVLLVLGIKYMIGSASEKAEYKKTMIPYIVGAVLILGASGIVKLLFSAVKIGG